MHRITSPDQHSVSHSAMLQAATEGPAPGTPDNAHPSPSQASRTQACSTSDSEPDAILDPNAAAATELGLAEVHPASASQIGDSPLCTVPCIFCIAAHRQIALTPAISSPYQSHCHTFTFTYLSMCTYRCLFTCVQLGLACMICVA